MSILVISPLFFILRPFRYRDLIFYLGPCAYRGCLISLNLKKTNPKQAMESKNLKKRIKSSKIKKHYPAHTKHNSTKKKLFYSVKLPFKHPQNPPKNAWRHISTHDWIHLFVTCLFFQKVQKICIFWKVANFCNYVNLLSHSPWRPWWPDDTAVQR